MAISIFVVICLLLLVSAIGIFIFRRKEVPEVEEAPQTPVPATPYRLEMNASDLVKLTNAEYIEQLDLLIQDFHIDNKLPAFYEKYQELNRQNKEKYFQNLLNVIAQGQEENTGGFLADSDMSTQDVLLILLMGMSLDNKTIARVLFISVDTLKKRKTRLKTKMKAKGIILSDTTY